MKAANSIALAARRSCAAIALVALSACALAPSLPETGPGYRDQSVPIGVTSRFDEARFAGAWNVRAALPATEATQTIQFDERATGLQLQVAHRACEPSLPCDVIGDTLQITREAPGRYVIQMPDGTLRQMWVIWVDESFRTAVVGNPDGTFAWILDRQPKGGADRIRAAREILDFNGYDLTQLEERP